MAAPLVQLRYVKFGTRFEFVPDGDRAATSPGNPSPKQLFRNEIALDVGGVCHGHNGETRWVIDHHLDRGEENFPSASAAVMHKAGEIVAHFAALDPPPDCIWIATHIAPDFDALCAAYLVRTLLLEDGDGLQSLHDPQTLLNAGLPPDGWRGFEPRTPGNLRDEPRPRFPWYNPPVRDGSFGWMLLLASTASHVDNCRPLRCKQEISLPAVFYAALERKRPFMGPDGARTFFDQARRAIVSRRLNPLYDPLFDHDSLYAPELQMLAGSEDAYERDFARARKSVVSLPWSEDVRAYYEQREKETLLTADGETRASQLSGISDAGAARARAVPLQVDGIFLRDPECLLFRQYARHDRQRSTNGEGFLFSAIAYSGVKSGTGNSSDYYFSLDPELAAGRHLYPLWARLQTEELRCLQRAPRAAGYLDHLRSHPICREGFAPRAGTADAPLFRDPWFDGGSYQATLIVTPAKGTFIEGEGRRSDLTDDTVVHLVSQILEGRSLRGPVELLDMVLKPAGSETRAKAHPGQGAAANEPPPVSGSALRLQLDQAVPPLPAESVRFVVTRLDEHLDLNVVGVGQQAGRQLWQYLYHDAGGGVPTDFVGRHLLVDRNLLCVWGRRGVALASGAGGEARVQNIQGLFLRLIQLVHDVEDLVTELRRHLDGKCCEEGQKAAHGGRKVGHSRSCAEDFQRLLDSSDRTLAAVADLQRRLAEPDGRLLFPFFEASRLRQVLSSARDVHMAASTRADSLKVSQSLEQIREVQESTHWLELVIVGVYFLEAAHITSQAQSRAHRWFLLLSTVAGVSTALLAHLAGDWQKRKPGRVWRRIWGFTQWFMRIAAIGCAAAVFTYGLWKLPLEAPDAGGKADHTTGGSSTDETSGGGKTDGASGGGKTDGASGGGKTDGVSGGGKTDGASGGGQAQPGAQPPLQPQPHPPAARQTSPAPPGAQPARGSRIVN